MEFLVVKFGDILESLQLFMPIILRYAPPRSVRHWNRLGAMSRVVGGRSSAMGVLEEGEVDV